MAVSVSVSETVQTVLTVLIKYETLRDLVAPELAAAGKIVPRRISVSNYLSKLSPERGLRCNR